MYKNFSKLKKKKSQVKFLAEMLGWKGRLVLHMVARLTDIVERKSLKIRQPAVIKVNKNVVDKNSVLFYSKTYYHTLFTSGDSLNRNGKLKLKNIYIFPRYSFL